MRFPRLRQPGAGCAFVMDSGVHRNEAAGLVRRRAGRHVRMRGFTLLEMVATMVVLAIISAGIAIFIRSPVEGYVDTVRRAEVVDMVDGALRRMRRDIRRAVPNSVRVNCTTANCYVEFLPSSGGGRYRAEGEGTSYCAAGAPTRFDALNFAPDLDTCFEILGPAVAFTAGDQVVVGNWGNPGSDAYEGKTALSHVRRDYAGSVGAQQKVVMASAAALPLGSPSKRFQVVAAGEQAVTFACEGVGTANGTGTGTLRRYWGYGIGSMQPTSFSAGSNALMADSISSCSITSGNLVTGNPYSRYGLVSIVLGVTRNNETVNLYHEIHVDNLP